MKRNKVIVIDKKVKTSICDKVGKIAEKQIQEEEGMTQKGKNKVASLKTKLDKEKDTDALEAQIRFKGQIALLKTQLENEKNATVKLRTILKQVKCL